MKPLSPPGFAEPPRFFTSALPSRFSRGIRQSSNSRVAVSEARIPSLFSTPSSFMPSVPAGTTKDLMPARPALLSTVAQTTTKPPSTWEAPSPAVQKILLPFSTHSSPSRVAVVWMAAASEPAEGSVIAIAPHTG